MGENNESKWQGRGKCNGCRLHLEFSATSDVSIFQTCSHDGNTRREPEPFVTVT